MAENLMNSAHKASTPASREGWDRIWGKDDKGKDSTDKRKKVKKDG